MGYHITIFGLPDYGFDCKGLLLGKYAVRVCKIEDYNLDLELS
jgi:hypothetical protein